MRFQTLTVVSAFLALVFAQKIEQDDIPSQCTSICADLVSTAQRCDQQNDDNDSAELDCICTSQNANTLVPNCELCVRTNNQSDDFPDDGNDVYDVLTSCSFQQAQQTSSGSMSSSMSRSGTVIQTSISTTGTIIKTSVSVTGTGASATPTTGAAAPANTGAVVGLGALGLALGLL